jgi:hypothetical protein
METKIWKVYVAIAFDSMVEVCDAWLVQSSLQALSVLKKINTRPGGVNPPFHFVELIVVA